MRFPGIFGSKKSPEQQWAENKAREVHSQLQKAGQKNVTVTVQVPQNPRSSRSGRGKRNRKAILYRAFPRRAGRADCNAAAGAGTVQPNQQTHTEVKETPLIFPFLLVPLAVAFWYWQKTSKVLGMPLESQLWGTLWRTWLYGFLLGIPFIILARIVQVGRLIHFIDSSSGSVRTFFNLILIVIGSVYTALVARYVAGKCKLRTGAGAAQTAHLGGAIVADASAQQKVNAEQWRSHLANKKENEYIQHVMLAGLVCPLESEARHFKMMGTTGSGKSVAIRSIMSFVQQRAPYTGDRVVIADPDGGYLARFYNPERGDVILNPFDARSAHWALFKELRNPYDADQFAASLVPDMGGNNSVWAGYARTLVSSAIQALLASGDARRVICMTQSA